MPVRLTLFGGTSASVGSSKALGCMTQITGRILMRKKLLLTGTVCLFLLSIATRVGAQAPGPGDSDVPPQFISFPILLHVNDRALDHGHFVFGGEAAIPAPIAPDLGRAEFRPALGG